MENFKDLPLWRQVYKIGFPKQYDENDTYEQAELKKAYKIRNLVNGVVSNDIIPDKKSYNIGSVTFSFSNIYAAHLFQTLGAASYSYDNVINDDTKLKTINDLEFSYTITASRYSAKTTIQAFDKLALVRSGNFGEYITLIALKLDNLNRRVKTLEENK